MTIVALPLHVSERYPEAIAPSGRRVGDAPFSATVCIGHAEALAPIVHAQLILTNAGSGRFLPFGGQAAHTGLPLNSSSKKNIPS